MRVAGTTTEPHHNSLHNKQPALQTRRTLNLQRHVSQWNVCAMLCSGTPMVFRGRKRKDTDSAEAFFLGCLAKGIHILEVELPFKIWDSRSKLHRKFKVELGS
ncbi:hypothetical protein AVEN_119422-1 [Araneus ventricosus]|uniref:Uncharacterized protein n=1 Tax=Araneus ventricosus TaxID=182803 RepID=A0A4Y2R7Z6_ARAVE|nr:hypothetical protein AVEN_119422-1 [Araneus ventricosus]